MTNDEMEELERLRASSNRGSGALDSWTRGLESGITGIGSFAAAALSGEEKLSSYTTHIGTMLTGFGGAGRFLTGSLGVITNYIDDATGSFQQISRSGFQLEDGLTGVGVQASRSGMQLQQFGKFVTDNSDMMRGLGSNGSSAIQAFATMSKNFREDSANYSQGLRRLGYSTEEINESLVSFAAINRTEYLTTARSTGARNRAAMEFALQMDRMAQLTGENRKELQKEMDAKRRDGRIQAFLRTEAGAMSDQINKSLTQTNRLFGSHAQALVEDILVQGSVTQESAAAAAFYGTEVTNAAYAMRAAQQADDSEGYAAAQRALINAMATATSDTSRIGVARIRSESGYINSIQDMIGSSTTITDQVNARLAEQGIAASEATRAQRDAAMDFIQTQAAATQAAAGTTAEGAQDGVGDGVTNAASSLVDSINVVSGAVREQLVNVLSNQVGPSLSNFSKTIDDYSDGIVRRTNLYGNATVGANDGSSSVEATEGATIGRASADQTFNAANASGAVQEGELNRLPPDLVQQLQSLREVVAGLVNNINPEGNFLGGTAIGGMMNMVGEQGPEFIVPNANSLIATAKQFADKARPQMEQMAASMGPQMEQMANQMRPQMEQMANQMRSGSQGGQDMEMIVAKLETGFMSLVKEMQNNNREVRKLTGNAYRV